MVEGEGGWRWGRGWERGYSVSHMLGHLLSLGEGFPLDSSVAS